MAPPPTTSRRAFLRASVAAGLAATLPGAAHPRPADGDDERLDLLLPDRALLGRGPLVLPPWPYGDASAAPDAVLMFRGNPEHTFYGTGPVPDRPRIHWRVRMRDLSRSYYGRPFTWRGTGWTGQAACYAGHVFVGSQGGVLYALDAERGAVRWRYEAGGMFKASVCLYRDRLYVGNVDDALRCLDARTGEVLWSLDTGRDLDSSACVADGRLYIAGENGHLRCLDPATGEPHWVAWVGGLSKGPTPGSYGSETSPAVADGEVYTATYDGWLHSFDARSGERRWRARTGDDTDASPVLWRDLVFTAAEDRAPYVFAFDRATGRERWRFRDGGGFWSTPAVAGETLYIGGASGRLLALDAGTGRLRWAQDFGSRTWSSPCVVDDRVLLGAFDGVLRCFDAETGALVWGLPLGERERMHATPCIVDGRIYVGTREGFFYGIGA